MSFIMPEGRYQIYLLKNGNRILSDKDYSDFLNYHHLTDKDIDKWDTIFLNKQNEYKITV